MDESLPKLDFEAGDDHLKLALAQPVFYVRATEDDAYVLAEWYQATEGTMLGVTTKHFYLGPHGRAGTFDGLLNKRYEMVDLTRLAVLFEGSNPAWIASCLSDRDISIIQAVYESLPENAVSIGI
jgi:hypothetical protein